MNRDGNKVSEWARAHGVKIGIIDTVHAHIDFFDDIEVKMLDVRSQGRLVVTILLQRECGCSV